MKTKFLFFTIFFLYFSQKNFAQKNDTIDIFELTIEELMKIEVTTITKTEVKYFDVPASMSIITKQDIKRYGYRNLAEALARVPEVYTHYLGNDHESDFRGFFTSMYPRRVLYLINGHKINDYFFFGDFQTSTIGDISNVERIEIVRGPGAALYGTVAVIGVVNIITTTPKLTEEKKTFLNISASLDDISENSFTQKYQLQFAHRFSEKIFFNSHFYWFSGKGFYDSETKNTITPWIGAKTSDGTQNIILQTDYFWDAKQLVTENKRYQLPNFTANLRLFDFNFGAILHGRCVTSVIPRHIWTLNEPDKATRYWNTSSIFCEWNPKKLKNIDFSAKISYNIQSRGNGFSFNAKDSMITPEGKKISMIENYAIFVAFPYFFRNEKGNFNAYLKYVKPRMTVAEMKKRGNEALLRWANVDKSWTFDIQASPYKSEMFTLTFGSSFSSSDNKNYGAYLYENNEVIAWSQTMKADGWQTNLWSQILFNWANKLIVTAGIRYDYQNIRDAHYEIDEIPVYTLKLNSQGRFDTVIYGKKNREAQDFTPRICLNYHLTKDFNIRFLYSQAFRAVSAQEILRYDGEVESEKTDNFEGILSYNISENFNLTFNAFRIKGNIVYYWNPLLLSYAQGSGWSNTGFSLNAVYARSKNFNIWGNITYYAFLERATNGLDFMKDYIKNPTNPPNLPNEYHPLDSPTFLAKAGSSYSFYSKTIISTEMYFNGEIKVLTPVNQKFG